MMSEPKDQDSLSDPVDCALCGDTVHLIGDCEWPSGTTPVMCWGCQLLVIGELLDALQAMLFLHGPRNPEEAETERKAKAIIAKAVGV